MIYSFHHWEILFPTFTEFEMENLHDHISTLPSLIDWRSHLATWKFLIFILVEFKSCLMV
jgi:hypothetical protein